MAIVVFSARILYPIIGHSFSDDDLQPIQKPVDIEVLHIIGLNEHFPRAVLRAPLKYGGLGCHTFHAQHVADKLVLFIHHIHERKNIAELLLASMSTTQLECGVSIPFFTLPVDPWYSLVTETWISHLWRECQPMAIDLRFEHELGWTPQAQRENDQCIMEVAARMYAGKDLLQINQCRIKLQVTYLSDIASVDGKRILRAYHTRQGHIEVGRRTRLHWPPIGHLPRKHWKLWMEFLEGWCGTALNITPPLDGGLKKLKY